MISCSTYRAIRTGAFCLHGKISAVDQVANVTKDTVIVESAIDPMESDIPYVRFVAAEGDPRLPGSWHPNMTALGALFLEAHFTRVERLFKMGGRGGLVAYR